jgi:hypothetical protein
VGEGVEEWRGRGVNNCAVSYGLWIRGLNPKSRIGLSTENLKLKT